MTILNGCDKFQCDFKETNGNCCIWESPCPRSDCKQYRDCTYCRNNCGGKNKSLLVKIVELTQK